jgi:L-threonylcarbamoyladenylate synthase
VTGKEPRRVGAGGLRRVCTTDPNVAAEALAAGGVVAVPTDTIYGLAARLDRPGALEAVFALKGRPLGLALPVLVGDEGQLPGLVARWPPDAARLAQVFWPGPLTIVVEARDEIGRRLGGDGRTVGLRQPAHEVVRGLCRMSGPLAVTSANRHGDQPCTTPEEVLATFGPGASNLAVVLDGGRCDGSPSTVVDCAASPPRCRREGGVPWDTVEDALKSSSIPRGPDADPV